MNGFGAAHFTGRQKSKSAEEDKLNLTHIKEAYAKITTNLDYLSLVNDFKCVLITSSIPQEGKSTTAVNTAISMAKSGKRVLLVDADMRRPTLHKFFRLTNSNGLSNAILNSDNLLNIICETQEPNLYFLSSGKTPPNPNYLLGSSRMKNLIEIFKNEFDFIIFDVPPVLVVSDATSLSQLVDGVIVVVRYGFTKTGIMQQTHEALKLVNANIIGTILNDIPREETSYYSGRYYHKYFRKYYK